MGILAMRAPEKYVSGIAPEMVQQPPGNVCLPNRLKHLRDSENAADAQKEVRNAVHAHCVAAPDDPADNFYIPTDRSGELIDVGNGEKVRMIVQNKTITVDGVEKQVTETIVEPENPVDVCENQIVLGGYSVNSPVYYQKYFPFAVTGKRFILINILGGGTEDYDKRDKKLSLYGGEASLEGHYYPESAAHISQLIREYKATYENGDTPKLTLAGYSFGGLVLEQMLARPDLLDIELLKSVKAIHIDAPVTPGRAPFGFGGHLARMVWISISERFSGIVGAAPRMKPGFVEKMLMSDLRRNAGDFEADQIINETTESCFTATGVFPEMVFDFTNDPMLGVPIDNPDRFDLLKTLPIHITYRPADKVVPPSKIVRMAVKWKALGLNVVITPCANLEGSHSDVPGLSFTEVVRNHGKQVLPLQ